MFNRPQDFFVSLEICEFLHKLNHELLSGRFFNCQRLVNVALQPCVAQHSDDSSDSQVIGLPARFLFHRLRLGKRILRFEMVHHSFPPHDSWRFRPSLILKIFGFKVCLQLQSKQ